MPASNQGGSKLCIGLMSGTSVDAIDAALVRIERDGEAVNAELIAYREELIDPVLRSEVFALFEQAEGSVARLCSLNFALGEAFAEAALEVCRAGGVSPELVFAIGSHGQTVWHQPKADSALPLSVPSTLQIGEPAIIAERTRIQVVANFRAADMASGGQGAPLVPYADWALLRHPTRNRAVQNIGGIGNVTWLPAGQPIEAVRAFDTGPGNMVIDGLVSLLTDGAETFDRDGRLAAAGRIDELLLDSWLADAYFNLPPPKTTGRERFGLHYSRAMLEASGLRPGVLAPGVIARPDDEWARNLIATATALTAGSIAESYRRWLGPMDEVIVGGGGSRNPTLMRMLRGYLDPIPVLTSEEVGIDSSAKEAAAFALLAHDALLGLPTNVPGATGARRAVRLGSITPIP